MVAVTVPIDAECLVVLSSNGDIGTTLAYVELGDTSPVHAYARANAQSTVVQLIEGRQAPVGFRPAIEGDADVFEKTFIVAMDTPGALVGADAMDRAAFDPLLTLIEDQFVSYVTVTDSNGRRWYTFPEFVQGTYDWRGHEAQATVKFTEVSIVAPVVSQ